MTDNENYHMTSSRQTLYGITSAQVPSNLAFTHNSTEFARVETDGTVRCDIEKLISYLKENPVPKPGHELMHSTMLLIKHMYDEGRRQAMYAAQDRGYEKGYKEGLEEGYDRGHEDGYNHGYSIGYECGYDDYASGYDNAS